jgi:hypothetical protein
MKEFDMFRKHLQSRVQLVAVATLVLGASGAAFADDGSMSVLTGDSYAYFNNLDYHPGGFNTPRSPQPKAQAKAQEPEPLAKMPKAEPAQTERRIRLADRPVRITLPSPFRDDTGA